MDPDPHEWGLDPMYVVRTPWTGPGSPHMSSGPLWTAGRVLDLHMFQPNPLPVWHLDPWQARPKCLSLHTLLVPTLFLGRGLVLPRGSLACGTSLHLEASSLPTFNESGRWGVAWCAQACRSFCYATQDQMTTPYVTKASGHITTLHARPTQYVARYWGRRLCLSVWKHLGPWLVLVINDNVILYVTNVCFAETNGKLGRMTGRSTTTVKTIPEIRTRIDG
jgi:hypothetical protein